MIQVPVRYNGKIYLAGPFFNEEQIQVQTAVEDLCKKHERGVFSPRLECLIKKHDAMCVRRHAFTMNVLAIKEVRLVLANIEGLDSGTIWEMGAAYAYGTPVVAYSPDPTRELNLMLAMGVSGYLAGLHLVDSFLEARSVEAIPGIPESYPDFNWEVVKPWHAEVF